jgi:phosphopantetheinyl transferase
VRKKEYLAVRSLLKAMKGCGPHITHTADGKPFLSGDTQHISITHSRNLAAIILSDFPAGIDTETTGRKVSDVAQRFLSEEEMAWTLNAPHIELAQLFCWSCKEAAYKMLGIPGIDFKHTLTVCPEEIREKGTSSVVFKSPGREKIIRMNYFLLANNIITWCVNI